MSESENPFLTADGCKALEITGWPEWEERGLNRDDEEDNFWIEGAPMAPDWRTFRYIDGHTATCLLSEHFRKWLVERGCVINAGGELTMVSWHDGSGGERQLHRSDYYLALIAAVLATGERGTTDG